jgi:hypothetical protein
MVARLERFDETLYAPQKIYKAQTKLEEKDNTLYSPKKYNTHKKSSAWSSSMSSP